MHVILSQNKILFSKKIVFLMFLSPEIIITTGLNPHKSLIDLFMLFLTLTVTHKKLHSLLRTVKLHFKITVLPY